MTIYTATLSIEAESFSEAWDVLSRVPRSFEAGTNWDGFRHFVLSGGPSLVAQAF